MDIEFDKNNRLIYKGVEMYLTREQICDLQINGIDPIYYVEEMYKKSTVYIRDYKIDLILGK